MTREEFDSVKKGDEVSLEWRDSISGNNSGKFKVKSTSTSKKYGRKKITMVSVKNPNSRPVYLYKEIDGERFEVEKGDVVCINDGEFHKVFNTGHLALIFLCVFEGGRDH